MFTIANVGYRPTGDNFWSSSLSLFVEPKRARELVHQKPSLLVKEIQPIKRSVLGDNTAAH